MNSAAASERYGVRSTVGLEKKRKYKVLRCTGIKLQQ